jgi:hypothetical protein
MLLGFEPKASRLLGISKIKHLMLPWTVTLNKHSLDYNFYLFEDCWSLILIFSFLPPTQRITMGKLEVKQLLRIVQLTWLFYGHFSCSFNYCLSLKLKEIVIGKEFTREREREREMNL